MRGNSRLNRRLNRPLAGLPLAGLPSGGLPGSGSRGRGRGRRRRRHRSCVRANCVANRAASNDCINVISGFWVAWLNLVCESDDFEASSDD